MSQAGTIAIDRDFVVRSWDSWIEGITGIDATHAVGRSLNDLFPEIVERGFAPRLQHVIQNDAVEVLSAAFHHYFIPCKPRVASPNFTRMQQHVTFSPRHEHGVVTGVLITIEDVTPRLDHEREIAQGLRSADERTRLRAAEMLATERATADTLKTAFADSSWKVRRAAVAGFAQRNGEEITAALTKALREQHRDLSVVNATLSALAISGKDVFPELVKYMHGDDADLRIYVALALGNMEDARATDILIDALDDENINVRYHAIEALGRIRARGAAQRLAHIAASGDFFLGFAALDALARIDDDSVVPLLLPLGENGQIAEALVQTLGAIGGAESVAAVCNQITRYAAPSVCAVALVAIHERVAAFGEDSVVPALAAGAITEAAAASLSSELDRAKHDDATAIVRVLGWLESDEATTALLRALSRDDTRKAAIEALVSHGTRAVAPLIDAVNAESEEAARAAVAALGRIGSQSAVPRLIEALQENSDMAVVAAHALGSLGGERAFEPLLELLDDRSITVRHAAIAALSSIGSNTLHDRIRDLLKSPSARSRECALRIAGYFGYEDCIGEILAACTDKDPIIRRAAMDHVAFFDDDRIPSIVKNALTDVAADVRSAAARSIGRLDGGAAQELLVAALNDPDPWVRYQAARSADAHATTRVLLPLCRQASSDAHPPARIAAIEALGRIADSATVRQITELVDDPDDDVAIAAIDALGMTSYAAARGTLVDALRSHSVQRRNAAIRALERSGIAAQTLDELARAARNATDPETAQNAVRALAAGGASVEMLCDVGLLPLARRACAVAIKNLFDVEPSAVISAFDELNTFGRILIMDAVGRSHAREAAQFVARQITSAEADVARAAALALARIDLRAATIPPASGRTERAIMQGASR